VNWVNTKLVTEETITEWFRPFRPKLLCEPLDLCMQIFRECVYELVEPHEVPPEIVLVHAAFAARCFVLDGSDLRQKHCDQILTAALILQAILVRLVTFVA
jgi:hypothetical protein